MFYVTIFFFTRQKHYTTQEPSHSSSMKLPREDRMVIFTKETTLERAAFQAAGQSYHGLDALSLS